MHATTESGHDQPDLLAFIKSSRGVRAARSARRGKPWVASGLSLADAHAGRLPANQDFLCHDSVFFAGLAARRTRFHNGCLLLWRSSPRGVGDPKPLVHFLIQFLCFSIFTIVMLAANVFLSDGSRDRLRIHALVRGLARNYLGGRCRVAHRRGIACFLVLAESRAVKWSRISGV